jgi:anti-sigma factor RsiW
MQCEQARALLSPYLDQELDAGNGPEVASHLSTCPACAAAFDDFGRIGRQLAAAGREPVPAGLAVRVRTALAAQPFADSAAAKPSTMAKVIWRTSSWMRQAAALVIAFGLSAAVTAAYLSGTSREAFMEREVVAAHVRSLLQDSPLQIASSETHTVKPWFTGRLDFSPPVKDLAAEGFPLAGARLDYINERRVAALVYKRRLHIVSVFVWPSPGSMGAQLRDTARMGYNALTWSQGGVTYWAVSDLNVGEMRQLQSLLHAGP